MSQTPHSIAGIANRLNQRISELARHLLGQPNQSLSTASQLRYGSKGSLAIEIDGPKRGQWFDHEQGKGGASIELICTELNMSVDGACEWALDWLGIVPLKENNYGASATSSHQIRSKDKFQKRQTEENLAAKPVPKATQIVNLCMPVTATPGEQYLKRRGITASLPDSLRYRPFAFGDYGALVVLATDATGQILAIQQIYVTDDGQKAPVKIAKRTNKAVDGWSTRAAARFPGKRPIILTEGPENALSVWQATGHETWACFGISNIGHAPLPENAPIIIARDGDLPGSKADHQIRRVIDKLVSRGHHVSIAMPPEGKDFNDLLCDLGTEAVRATVTGATSSQDQTTNIRTVLIGSDVEIANRIHKDLTSQHGEIIHAENQFWRYGDTHWEAIPEHALRLAAHLYDGAYYETPKGEPSRVKLGKGRVDSILHEMATLTTSIDFFAETPTGINCASGFIRFASDGIPDIELHQREHRARHTLPGHWPCPPEALERKDTFLSRLLEGVFKGDDDAKDKNLLLAEVCGSAALGYATKLLQPRAAIGRRIAKEEADLLLAWAVEGASRLIRQRNFTIPASSRIALTDWILGADPVLAWLYECVEIKPEPDSHASITTREAYEKFREWAIAEGFKNDKLPAINGFVQRVQANANGIEYKRTSDGRIFIGMVIRNTAVSSPPPSRFSDDA